MTLYGVRLPSGSMSTYETREQAEKYVTLICRGTCWKPEIIVIRSGE